jgi:hypothetical protein
MRLANDKRNVVQRWLPHTDPFHPIKSARKIFGRQTCCQEMGLDHKGLGSVCLATVSPPPPINTSIILNPSSHEHSSSESYRNIRRRKNIDPPTAAAAAAAEEARDRNDLFATLLIA